MTAFGRDLACGTVTALVAGADPTLAFEVRCFSQSTPDHSHSSANSGRVVDSLAAKGVEAGYRAWLHETTRESQHTAGRTYIHPQADIDDDRLCTGSHASAVSAGRTDAQSMRADLRVVELVRSRIRIGEKMSVERNIDGMDTTQPAQLVLPMRHTQRAEPACLQLDNEELDRLRAVFEGW